MDNPSNIENYFKQFISNINLWLPEGIATVNLDMLHSFGLLKYFDNNRGSKSNLTRYFQLFESNEKITLINNQFIVWIVPEQIQGKGVTYIFIALNYEDHPQLEIAFSTTGIYNSSRLVLSVLEHYLLEIQETEDALNHIKKS